MCEWMRWTRWRKIVDARYRRKKSHFDGSSKEDFYVKTILMALCPNMNGVYAYFFVKIILKTVLRPSLNFSMETLEISFICMAIFHRICRKQAVLNTT